MPAAISTRGGATVPAMASNGLPPKGRLPTPPGLLPCPLDRLLRQLTPDLPWTRARRLVTSGKVRVDGRVVTDPQFVVRDGMEVEVHPSAPRPRSGAVLDPERLVHVDGHVIVVNKPPGMSTVPFDATERGTLEQLLGEHLKATSARNPFVGLVHRLDKDTSGLLVFARSRDAQRHLKQQFRFHTIIRKYVALAHGHVTARTITSNLVANRGDGRRGSTHNPRLGRTAVTHVRPLGYLRGTTLVECRLETGRTHQIRIHLAEAGHPLVGERVYVRPGDHPDLGAPRIMLHATLLGFTHPTTGQALRFEQGVPDDMQRVLECLRA